MEVPDPWQKVLKNILWSKLVYFIFFTPLILHSQISIKGAITDSIGVVPFANVLLKDSKKNIISYTFSNENGYYNLDFSTKLDSLFLEFNSISHHSKRIYFSEFKEIKDSNFINVKLDIKVNQLNEVIVEKKIPIRVKKDTLIYDPELFKDGSERVVEDLLKKLPGIKVENSGEIFFKGKPIKKLLLDGDDLFDQNYLIGSRNINADMIEKVEGIENFEENTLLKGIRNSDEVALNLILKKGKTDFSGNVSIGYGIEDRWHNDLTGLLVNKKAKGFTVNSFNNVGINNTPYDLESKIISFESSKNRNLNSNTLISEGNFYSELENKFHRINENFYSSFNFLGKIKKKSSLRFNTGIYLDKLSRIQSNNSTIFSDNEIFVISESNDQNKSPKLYDFKFQFLNKERENFHWEYLGKFFYSNTNFKDFSINNSFEQFNHVTTETLNLNQIFNSTYKFKDNQALVVSLHHVTSKAPQSLNISPGTVIDGLIASNQESVFSKDYINWKSSYYYSKNKFSLGLHSNFFNNRTTLKTSLTDSNNQLVSENFSNNNLYDISNVNIHPVLVYNSEKISFKFGLNSIYNKLYLRDVESSDQSSEIFFTPKFYAIYHFDSKKSVSLGYDFNQIAPDENQIFSGAVQTGYRSFISNELNLEFLRTHSYNLSFKYNDYFNLRLLNVNFNYNQRPDNYFFRNTISQTISITENFYANIGAKDFGISISGETYLHSLRSTILLNSRFQISQSFNILNDSELRQIRNNNLFLNFTIRRGLKKWMFFENITTFSNTEFIIENENLITNLKSLSNQSKIILNPTESFRAIITGNFISPNLREDEKYFFLESELTFTPKNKKIAYSLIGRNLSNNKSFTINNVSNFSTNTISHNLIPRFIMLKASYGF